jgi:hypothetical protein
MASGLHYTRDPERPGPRKGKCQSALLLIMQTKLIWTWLADYANFTFCIDHAAKFSVALAAAAKAEEEEAAEEESVLLALQAEYTRIIAARCVSLVRPAYFLPRFRLMELSAQTCSTHKHMLVFDTPKLTPRHSPIYLCACHACTHTRLYVCKDLALERTRTHTHTYVPYLCPHCHLLPKVAPYFNYYELSRFHDRLTRLTPLPAPRMHASYHTYVCIPTSLPPATPQYIYAYATPGRIHVCTCATTLLLSAHAHTYVRTKLKTSEN